MWTDELIAKLRKMVRDSRMYRVSLRGDRLHAIDKKPENGWLRGFYLTPNSDEPSGDLADFKPSDFSVVKLVEFNWIEGEV